MALQGLVLAIVLVVILPAYVVYKPPKLLIGYFQARFPQVLFQVETSRKIIALTIDDAPSPFTEQILDILKANNAKATFFAIGDQIPERDFVLADIVRQGHELGNHAMHDEPSISIPSDVLTTEIVEVDKALYMAHQSAGKTRSNARYFRPGSGVFSRRILDVASKLGYQTILGSIYPHDPFIKYWRINAWHILSMARPGAVIICHDRRSWTVPMLQKVLPELKKRGYEVVTVSGLLDVTHGT
ncbi:glycoside hydrolase/deacetylase [Teratosphaeria nubilosa]|uniref:chitin deacetylase n=1 Tax=Teratosphaeria nubilosa TaxID=161662 RepID=A0A6G1L870_9PEZI|nr:glycoside hydrolase/deacetylase [Teratosphaeria nubilosa]